MKYLYYKLIGFYYLVIGCFLRLRIHYNHTGKVALCCIAKCENDYIKEFVAYYKQLGFDRIYIYDNNNSTEEDISNILSDYVRQGYCEIIDYKDKTICQLKAYQDCYETHKHHFDWIAYFDCDEFLTFTQSITIKEFLRQKQFNRYQLIHINWMVYGDNNLLYNDGRKVVDRFVKPIYPLNFKRQFDFPENNHIKTIMRGNLHKIYWNCTPHTPISLYYKCCNPIGKECDPNSAFHPYDFSKAYIRHYFSKTIDEWMNIKQKRGYPDQDEKSAALKLATKTFFTINIWSREKQKIVNKYDSNLHE